jgi:hypothetical protein
MPKTIRQARKETQYVSFAVLAPLQRSNAERRKFDFDAPGWSFRKSVGLPEWVV